MNESTSGAITVIVAVAVMFLTIVGSFALVSYIDSLVVRECYEAAKTNKDLKCEK